jgi:uncharacterized membrane protein YhhN
VQIFLVIFAIVSVAQIVFISLGKKRLRQISKVLIIPPLLGAYISGAGFELFFPITALIFGWIGDILLLRKDREIYFKLGLSSFLLGHIFYIITFIKCLGNLNITALAVSIPLAILLGIITFRFIKPTRKMTNPVIIYTIVIETACLLALQIFISNLNFAGALIFLGYLFFLVSDLILSYYAFRMLKRLGAVFIMSFYMIAQAGIILGLVYL